MLIFSIINPDISRPCCFHQQGTQGCCCSFLLQSLDNEADGSSRDACKVKKVKIAPIMSGNNLLLENPT